MRGAFIVIEGPDGCGTTLHTRLLTEHLQADNETVITTSEPTRGPIGLKIREKLHNHEEISPEELQKLFCDDRKWHLENVIEPALCEGTIVISDRYAQSTLAYGQAQGIEKSKLKNMIKDFIQPDCLFFLLPPFEVCCERMGRRDNHDALEKRELQRKVYDIYQQMASEDSNIHVVDTSGGKAEISGKIYDIIKKLEIKNEE